MAALQAGFMDAPSPEEAAEYLKAMGEWKYHALGGAATDDA
jgi:hypothetical protein